MSDERSVDSMMDNPNPNGFCPNCRQAMIQINGKPGCPNCSTKSKTRSGIVNMADDPGEIGLTSQAAKPNLSHLQINNQPVSTHPVVEVDNSATNTGYSVSLDMVYSYLSTLNVDSIPRFKALLKLKKQALDLKTKIQLFLDQA